ncbi:MAG: ABC transporter permease [Clostridiales bacterium]|nr:ABC transporter permease [Clostridiales bacterium]
MYFKLSLKNVKKSFNDYTLYFLTLAFGVCIFYIFNSIEAQKAMMSISESTAEIMKTVTKLMEMISVFVAVILGFLIVYANNFLIRKRKKEIGIYMTLGMGKGKVAKLLVAETFIIGVLSLGVGLLAGIFLSQGLSVITAKLFEADMTKYQFIFSYSAFLKTTAYFGIIFIVVMAASTISISRYKLIDLINAEKKNEKQRIKNPIVTALLFTLSVACLAVAYALVLKNGITRFDNRLLFEVILGSIGTFLFFASLSGFFLKILQSNRKLYLKGLNMFILRQINSRINTAHVSMSFICLMLFFTIGILSTGLGINKALNESYKYTVPFDASFMMIGNGSTQEGNIEEKLKQYGINIDDYAQNYVKFPLYQYSKESLTNAIVFKKVGKMLPDDLRQFGMGNQIKLMRLSDYNDLMKLQGKEGINLSGNQIALHSEYAAYTPDLKRALSKFIEMKYTVKISGIDYTVYPKLITDAVMTGGGNIALLFIVPDKMASGNTVIETIISLNCKGDRKATERKLESDLYVVSKKYDRREFGVSGATRGMIKDLAAGSKAIISFVGIYLGIIFLLTSAAILALQQLSEAADNRSRYSILRKVGADDGLINSALFKQIAIYFMMPLSLACIHSIVGIKVANDAISDVGSMNVLGNIIMTAVLIIIVYGSYFLATYFSSRSIILKGGQNGREEY